jgi:hypothetical protein
MNAKLKLGTIAFTVTLITLLTGCEDEAKPNQQKYPFLSINDVSNVNSKGAEFNGELDLPGTSVVSEYGFEWTRFTPSELTPYYRLSLGNDIQKKFSAAITSDLWNNELYFVRAYAITENYTVYTNSVSFHNVGATPPEIFSLSPSNGTEGTEITIVGKNFGHGNPLNEKFVSLGYYHFMEVVSFTDTVIIVKAPPAFSIPKGTYNIELMFGDISYKMDNVSFTFE